MKSGNAWLQSWEFLWLKYVTLTTESITPLRQFWLSWNEKHQPALWDICIILWWHVTCQPWQISCSSQVSHVRDLLVLCRIHNRKINMARYFIIHFFFCQNYFYQPFLIFAFFIWPLSGRYFKSCYDVIWFPIMQC